MMYMKKSMAEQARPCGKVLYNLTGRWFFFTCAKAVFQNSCVDYETELSVFAQAGS